MPFYRKKVHLYCLCIWPTILGRDEADIHELALALQEEVFDLEQEDGSDGSLLVKLVRNSETSFLEMWQDGLIGRVVDALVLEDGVSKDKWTPDESKTLVKDEDGLKLFGSFSFSRVVVIILYLAGHTHPYICYAFKFL